MFSKLIEFKINLNIILCRCISLTYGNLMGTITLSPIEPDLVWFYGISTIVYIKYIYHLVWLGFMAYQPL